MQRRSTTILIAVALIISASFASTVAAREDFVDLSVQEATESSIGKQKLLDIPFFMAGQKHKGVAKKLGVFPSNRRTNAFGKSDEKACSIAFLSAIISLQSRARSLGADAVIDIKSITRHNDLTSVMPTRCQIRKACPRQSQPPSGRLMRARCST